MLLDLLLIITIIFLSFWIVILKAQLKKIHSPTGNNLKQSIDTEQEFYSCMHGFSKNDNTEFDSSVLLDPLTNLPSHAVFEDRLLQIINQSNRNESSFGIMLFDVNNFRLINEKHGYEIGDKLIISLGNRLQSVIRQVDTLTRFAGDKFIVLLPQLFSPQTTAYVAQRLIDACIAPFTIDEKKILITSNIGIAIYPNDGSDSKILLRNVTDALNQAKQLGSNHFRFYREEMHMLGQRELEMHDILSSDKFLDHLMINYQPQINTQTGEIVAIQASPVLKLENYGDIQFKDFARTAENCKKAIAIWEWLLHDAATQFKKWQENGIKAKYLVIDVTYNQIQNPQFIHKITQILKEFNFNPKELIFEVIEKNLTKNIESIEQSFSMLNDINIQIGLNVFALGRLALHKITRLPITYLKIDASLVKNGSEIEKNEAILQTLAALAEESHINLIVENVETNIQKQLLEKLGYNVMQGKLYSESYHIK